MIPPSTLVLVPLVVRAVSLSSTPIPKKGNGPSLLSYMMPLSLLVGYVKELEFVASLGETALRAMNPAGTGIGAMLSATHGFNTGIPFVQKHVKGSKWLPFVVGLPPLLMYSAASAAFGGYALPRFTQLTVTSYYAASSASHYGVSLLTRQIEEAHMSTSRQEKL